MKRFLLFFILLCQFVLQGKAEEASAVYVWVNGSNVCYQLSSMPTITYKDGAAVLTLNNSSTPVLTLILSEGAELEVTYGKYVSDGINHVAGQNAKVRKVGKYIVGGQLVIIKDGKHFDVNGRNITK